MFRRTNIGLSNLSLFLGVDVVVYVEGGKKNFTIYEIERGEGETGTHDVAFWSILFSHFRPNTTVEIRSIGSKAPLIKIANLIELKLVTNLYVAMDRDYDNYLGRIISSPGVLYTRGYSFENDLWRPDVILAIFQIVCPQFSGCAEVREKVTDSYNLLYKELVRAVRVDIALANGDVGLILSKDPESFIKRRKGNRPHFMTDRLKHVLQSIPRNTKYYCPSGITINVANDCHGSLSKVIGRGILNYVLSLYKVRSIHSDVATGIAITALGNCLSGGDWKEHESYYDSLFSALPV